MTPVIGIVVDGPEKIGNVTFIDGKKWLAAKKTLPSDSDPLILNELKEIEKWVVAEYKIVAESERAKERAYEETRLALDVLRFTMLPLYGNVPVEVGFVGDVVVEVRQSFCFDSAKFAGYGSTRTGAYRPYDFKDLTPALRTSLGIEALSEMLCKEPCNSFERLILNCLFWYSSGFRQRDPHNTFLNYITCLEAVFNNPGNALSIGEKVKIGTTSLVIYDEAARKTYKKRLGKLYSRRSAISHGGSRSITEKDISEVRKVVFLLLVELLNRRPKYSDADSFWKDLGISGDEEKPLTLCEKIKKILSSLFKRSSGK